MLEKAMCRAICSGETLGEVMGNRPKVRGWCAFEGCHMLQFRHFLTTWCQLQSRVPQLLDQALRINVCLTEIKRCKCCIRHQGHFQRHYPFIFPILIQEHHVPKRTPENVRLWDDNRNGTQWNHVWNCLNTFPSASIDETAELSAFLIPVALAENRNIRQTPGGSLQVCSLALSLIRSPSGTKKMPSFGEVSYSFMSASAENPHGQSSCFDRESFPDRFFHQVVRAMASMAWTSTNKKKNKKSSSNTWRSDRNSPFFTARIWFKASICDPCQRLKIRSRWPSTSVSHSVQVLPISSRSQQHFPSPLLCNKAVLNPPVPSASSTKRPENDLVKQIMICQIFDDWQQITAKKPKHTVHGHFPTPKNQPKSA